MSTFEEAREQARKALARYESQSANSPFHFGLDDHMYIALRALLDATELGAPKEGDYHEGLEEGIKVGRAGSGPRPITDEMVEAAARVMFDAPGGMTGDYTWAEMVGEDPSRADIWRADARAALEAAEGARR